LIVATTGCENNNPSDIENLNPPVDGCLTGVFSVSAKKKVYFSKGNLQCKPTTKTWRFAEHQYDYIAKSNQERSMTFANWIDLFAWSTTSTYYGITTDILDEFFTGSFVDWGTAIGESWYTLSYDELKYLYQDRTNASNLFGVAKVNGVNGFVLLPDSWVLPSGLTFSPGFLGTKGESDFSSKNCFSATEWVTMETAGAVFVPAADTWSCSDNTRAFYWSSSVAGYDPYVVYAAFNSGEAGVGWGKRYSGYSVRLVYKAN